MNPTLNLKHFGSLARAVGLTMVALAAVLFIAACEDTPEPAPTSQPAAVTQPAPAAQPATAAQPAAPQPAAPAQPAAAAQPAPTSQPAAAAQPTAAPSAGSAPRSATAAPKLNIVTTTNFVADWVRVVGGDRVEVVSLLPPGGDPHSLSPGARDVAMIADADVVMSVGLELEAGWLEELLHNASSESKIVALGDGVDPIEFSETGGHDDHGDEGDAHMEGHDDHEDDHGEALVGRLLVGDGEEGNLSVIDLESGEVEQARFDMGARAGRIYATQSGRYAVAVATDANTAHVFDGGIFMEPHGDHFDLVEGDVRRLSLDLSGDRPSHLYVGDEWAAIFYDGSGDIALLNEHELEEMGDSYTPVMMNAGAQHGGTVPLEGDLFATTTQHPDFDTNPTEYRLPIGADIRDIDGNILYSADGCEGLHGDAGNGHMAAFGCVGGVLVVEAHDGEYSHVFVSAPDGSPEDFRLTSVWGYHGLDHFFALGSAVGLYIVEPEEGEMEQFIPSTENLRPIQVALGQGGETLFVVMSDGELRMYDAHDLDLLASNSGFLTTPVETGFWGRPHLATAGDAVFITDSVGGEVLQLDGHDLEVVNHWDVDGAPTKIAFVGILGEHGEHEGHDDHDDHADDHDDHEGHDDHDDHEGEDEDAHAHHDHAHGLWDPHFWFDPIRVKIAVNEIAARLSVLDPESAGAYFANAAAYEKELDMLHEWTLTHVAMVPPERRLLITSHDSLSYFAKLYGFEVVGLVIPSLSTHVEPSAEHIAGLIETVHEHDVPAVFGETTVDQKIVEALARETGAELVQLYSGSLGEEGSGADTYISMVRTNVERIVEALK